MIQGWFFFSLAHHYFFALVSRLSTESCLEMHEKAGSPAVISGLPVPRMPLVENRGTLWTLIAMCGCRTRLSLSRVCTETERCVMAVIRKESRPPLVKLGTVLSTALPVFECHSSEVPAIVAAAISEQFIVCVSQCYALLFVKRGDRWLVAVHCDLRRVAVVGWKPRPEYSQRPIRDPITEVPTVALSQKWETNVRGGVWKMANCGGVIAVAMKNGAMALLNAHTGAVVTDALKGTGVAFLDKERVVGVMFDEETGKYVLREFTANVLSKEVPIEARCIASVKASANGKRLYVADSGNRLLLEYCTGKWLLTARIPLSGVPLGQCDIAANGLLAQCIKHNEDWRYHIEVVETNTRCVAQTIRTKHTGYITQVVFSPDSSRVMTISRDKSVQLFDAITGQMVGEPRVAHIHYANSVCFLSDDWFVTVSVDKSLVVWHCNSQPPIARFEDAHSIWINSVLSLSTDSFVTGDGNGTLKHWKLECK